MPARLCHDLVDAIVRGRHGLLARRLQADVTAGTFTYRVSAGAWANLCHLAARGQPEGGAEMNSAAHQS